MTIDFLTSLLNSFFDKPDIVSFRLMTQGKENTTALIKMADGNHIIARLWGETHGYMGTHSEGDIKDEIAFMDFCSSHDLPVPRLFHSKLNNPYEQAPDGRYYAIMEYVDGDSPQRFNKSMVIQIAETMARMHLLVADFVFPEERSWPGTVLDMTNDRITRFEAGEFSTKSPEITEAIAHYRTLLQTCDLEALPRDVIHGDIMWENIKFKDGKLQGIFDFGDCRESYFVEDIAKSLFFAFESPEHSIFGETGKNVPVFLDAYQNIRQLTAAEKQSLPLFFLCRFIYQTLGYYAKIAKGKTEYETPATDIIARYTQFRSFFDQTSF